MLFNFVQKNEAQELSINHLKEKVRELKKEQEALTLLNKRQYLKLAAYRNRISSKGRRSSALKFFRDGFAKHSHIEVYTLH
jgi:hypothetical protein